MNCLAEALGIAYHQLMALRLRKRKELYAAAASRLLELIKQISNLKILSPKEPLIMP